MQSGWGGSTQSKAEVIHSNPKKVEYLHIDGIFIQIDKVHIFSDLLHSSFRGKGANVGTNITMSIWGNLYKKLITKSSKKRLILLVRDQHPCWVSCSLYESKEFQDVLLGLEYQCQLLDQSIQNTLKREQWHTTTFERALRPSIWVSNWETTWCSTSPLV